MSGASQRHFIANSPLAAALPSHSRLAIRGHIGARDFQEFQEGAFTENPRSCFLGNTPGSVPEGNGPA